MAYWIFKCNPEKYRLSDRLANLDPNITWLVTRHRDQIGPGDIIFLWVTGRERGIRAVLRAVSVPQDMPEWESEQLYWAQRDEEVRCRVQATITNRSINIGHEELRAVPGLEGLPVFSGFQQGTNFPVRTQEGEILERLIDGGSLTQAREFT